VYYVMATDRGPLMARCPPEEITMMSFRKRFLTLAMVSGLAVFGVACDDGGDDAAEDPVVEEPADDLGGDDAAEDPAVEDEGMDDEGMDDLEEEEDL
jgi:hypothetical protein